MYTGEQQQAPRAEQTQRRQEQQAQQPQAAERPKTVGEQIKLELDHYKAWSAYYDQQAKVVASNLSAVDQRLAGLPVATRQGESARQEYAAITAEQQTILQQQNACAEAVARLQKEYDPFQKLEDAVKQLKTSSEAIPKLQAEQTRFREGQSHFTEQLQQFEEAYGAQEQEWKAKLQETQTWTEQYRTELEKLKQEHDLQRFHFSIAFDVNGQAKPGYEQFAQQVQATQQKMAQHQATIEHNAQWMNWYDGQLNAIDAERSRLTGARDGAAKGLEDTLNALLAEEQKMRVAEAQHDEALPQAQANAYARRSN